MTDKPSLTLVDNTYTAEHELEFAPLPYYPWDIRPATLPLDADECATAIYLGHGDMHVAARLLKVPYVRLHRMVRRFPRLQRVQDESYGETLARAASIPIQTLFDSGADARRLEWASTKVLQSRLAMGHPLSPAPAANTVSTSMTVSAPQRTITFKWKGEDGDDGGSEPIDAA